MPKSNISFEDQEKYRKYVEESVPAVNQLVESLKDDGQNLDFSSNSLKILDEILNQLVPRVKAPDTYEEVKISKSAELSQKAKWFVVRISYYLALMCIKNWGAGWELDEVRSSPYYKSAVIVIPEKKFKIDPIAVVFAVKANGKNIYDWYKRLDDEYGKNENNE